MLQLFKCSLLAISLQLVGCATTTWPEHNYQVVGYAPTRVTVGYTCPDDYYYQRADHTCRYAIKRVMPTEQESRMTYYRELAESHQDSPGPKGQHKIVKKVTASKIPHGKKLDCAYILENINKCTN